MNEPLNIELEFLRADRVAEPHGMRFGRQRYLLRREKALYEEATLDWGGNIQDLLSQLQKPGAGNEQVQRVGEHLRTFLLPAGWESYEEKILQSVREGRPVRITILSAAAELYALPWELIALAPTGERLCQLRDCTIQYEWPGASRCAGPLDLPPTPRVLFAWAGNVPAAKHQRALAAASSKGGANEPARVVTLEQVTRESLRQALEEATATGAPFSALHLLCHGVVQDDVVHLVLSDPDGGPDLVDPGSLRGLVSPFAASLRLVVLCACNAGQPGSLGSRLGSVALALHRGTIDGGGIASVVASRFPFSVSGSIAFTQAFYAKLGPDGVHRALLAAREALDPDANPQHRLDHASLVHFALPGAEDLKASGGDAPDVLRPHDVLANGRYEVLERIYVGGSTTIWRAYDHGERGLVAVKALKEERARDEAERRRFTLGIERAAALVHPRIVRIVERPRTEGALVYAVIEFVPGGNLQDAVLSGALMGSEALAALLCIGDAVEHIWRNGSMRGAVTPRRVLLDTDGGAKLLDSGLVVTNGESRRVSSAAFVYTAPEVSNGQPVDVRSDVYGLGMVAIFCLHGQVLPLQAAIDPPAFVGRLDCPEGVKAVLRRAVARNPADRFPSVADLCRELGAPTSSSGAGADKFVGREKQLAQLQAALALAAAGQTQVGFVSGDTGAGKTALLRELARRVLATPEKFLVVVGHAVAESGEGDAYAPFIEILTQLTGGAAPSATQDILRAEHAREQRHARRMALEKLAATAPHLVGPFLPAPALAARARFLGGLEGKGRALERIIDDAGKSTTVDRTLLLREYVSLIEAIASERPLLILLEDLHWADSASLQLFSRLAQIKDRRIFLLGSFRDPEVALGRGRERHPLAGVLGEVKRAAGAVTVDLDVGSSDEQRAFVSQMVDMEPNLLDTGFRESLCEHTNGNPLFTLEILRMLKQRGILLKGEQGRWAQQAPLDWPDLPPKVEGVIEECLERLSEEMRRLLDVASVQGREFTAQVVGKIEKVGERDLLKSLSCELEGRHHLVRAGTTTKLESNVLSQYSFTNGLLQSYLYARLPEGERIELHDQIAGILEGWYRGCADAIAIQLAHHYDAAGNAARAIYWYIAAGKRALQMSAYFEAHRSLRRALALLLTNPEGSDRDRWELELRNLLGNVEKTTRGWASAEAKAEYDRAHELLKRVKDPQLRTSVGFGVGAFHLVRGELHVAFEACRRALQLAEETGDRDIESAGRMAMANVSFWLGDLRETCAQAEALERIYDAEAFREHRIRYGQDPYVLAQTMRACALWIEGRPESALRVAKENVELAERLHHPFSTAIALMALAWQHLHLRDPDATLAVAERLIDLAETHNFPSYGGLGKMFKGWVIARGEREPEGAALMKQGFASWSNATPGAEQDTDYPGLSFTFYAMLVAEVGLRAGRRADALAILGRGLDVVRDHDERPYGPELWRLKGECLAAGRLTKRSRAIECLRRALRDAAERGAWMLSLRAAVSLGHHARSPEERAEAREALKSALTHVTEGPAIPDLLDAQRALFALEKPDGVKGR